MTPTFKLEHIKWFQAEFAATRTCIRGNTKSINKNGEMVSDVLKKQLVLEELLNTLTEKVNQIQEKLKDCPHKKPNSDDGNEGPPNPPPTRTMMVVEMRMTTASIQDLLKGDATQDMKTTLAASNSIFTTRL